MILTKGDLHSIGSQLIKNRHSVAIAESVTAGLLQQHFSNIDQALNFFEGGITAYNLKQKFSHLFIDPAHALTCNCVSETVAAQMATGVTKLFKSDFGIGVTGYASPIPEFGLRELFACYAFAFKQNVIFKATLIAGNCTPRQVQEFYAESIIKAFKERLQNLLEYEPAVPAHS